jgi:hypothetical protein
VKSFLKLLGLSLIVLSFLSCSRTQTLHSFENEEHRYGFKDERGNVVIEAKYFLVEEFANGMAAVADKTGWAYIDAEEKVLIRPFIVDNFPDPFQDGLARFVQNEQFGFFDQRGNVAIPAQFTYAGPFIEDRAAFCKVCTVVKKGEYTFYKEGLWGYIDKKGDIVIPPRYELTYDFEGGQARVRVDGKWVMINRDGVIEPPQSS